MKEPSEAIVELLVAAAAEAGSNSLAVLRDGFATTQKSDRTPVTRADTEADTLIRQYLEDSDTPVTVSGEDATGVRAGDIAIVSEEHQLPPTHQRHSWRYYFLVDPLDGTRGFSERGEDFSINIALMHDEVPQLGVVALPLVGQIYVGGPCLASLRVDGDMAWIRDHSGYAVANAVSLAPTDAPDTATRVQPGGEPPEADRRVRVVASRNNFDESTQRWIHEVERYAYSVELVHAGSAAKFCMLADGSADVYPRFAPCMEWDTAAGVAIVRGVGGQVVDAETRTHLTYGNPQWYSRPFIAMSHAFFRATGTMWTSAP